MMVARIALAACLLAGSAEAADAPARDACEVGSGLGTRACLFPEGQVVVETDLIDRTVDHAGGLHTDSLFVGDTLVHIGLRRGLEAQVGWVGYDREQTRIVRTGEELRSAGIGDLTLGAKLALVDPQDHAFGLAIQPTISIPTGQLELGTHGLGGSVLIPASYDLGETLTVELTPEANYTGNRADDDRHWEYGATLGLVWQLDARLTATAEYRLFREDDPAFRRTKNVGAISASWLPIRQLQLNLGVGRGLDRRSPRWQLLAGAAIHFL